MGRGGDLTDHERSFVFNKIMQNWNSELKQIKVEEGRKSYRLASRVAFEFASQRLTELQEKRSSRRKSLKGISKKLGNSKE